MKKIIMTVALALMAGMLPTSKVQAQDVITAATNQVDAEAAAKAEKEARKAQKAQEKAEKKAKKAEKEAKKRKKAKSRKTTSK